MYALLSTIGNAALLDLDLTAFFCSRKPAGSLILPTYDLIRALRDRGAPLIGGFQTGLEAECLTLLLRGAQPVIVCPNRGIEAMRVPPEWREAVADGRLLIASPFPAAAKRKTAALAAERNRFVIERCARVLVTSAQSGGGVERAARIALEIGKPVFTIEHPANAHLADSGVTALPFATLAEQLATCRDRPLSP